MPRLALLTERDDPAVSRRTPTLLPQNDRERESYVTECRKILMASGFAVERIGHRTWAIERSLSTSSMCCLARIIKARSGT